MNSKNNWYAISGVASSGKTTIINKLEEKGYNTVHEAATEFVKMQFANGFTIEQIRKNEEIFQEIILHLKVFYENLLDFETVTFIDRGLPDTVAFYKMYNIEMPAHIKKLIANASYKKIFLFERLPLIKEDYRPEPEAEIAQMDQYNKKAYEELGHTVISVPVMSIEERLQFVIDNL